MSISIERQHELQEGHSIERVWSLHNKSDSVRLDTWRLRTRLYYIGKKMTKKKNKEKCRTMQLKRDPG